MHISALLIAWHINCMDLLQRSNSDSHFLWAFAISYVIKDYSLSGGSSPIFFVVKDLTA